MRPLLLLVGALLWAPHARAADPLDGAGLAAHLESLEATLTERQGGTLPQLSESDFVRLASGEPVIMQQTMEGTDTLGATVFHVAEVQAWQIWLAICDRDHHEEFMPHIREGVCLDDFGHSRLVYQYLSLPAVKDRHWIIRTRTNGPLWATSGHTVWESYWELEPDAQSLIEAYAEQGVIEKITSDEIDAAVVTPRNDGCWLLIDLPDGRCFIAYQDLSDIGGKIPSWLVNEFGPGGLVKLVREVEKRAANIDQHFGTDRPPPAAPDGSKVEQLQLP